MMLPIGNLRGSWSMKVGVIAILVIVMLVPLAMIRDVVRDRQDNSKHAKLEIMRVWGSNQTIGGPILVLPYKLERVTQYGERLISDGNVFFLPRNLSVNVELVPEIRYRGIHKVPVYTAQLQISGAFGKPGLDGLGIDGARVDWGRAYLALSISDAKSIRSAPEAEVNGEQSRFGSGSSEVSGIAPQIKAPVGDIVGASDHDADVSFFIRLDLSGTQRLEILPFGDDTSVTMQSGWPSPSFVGGYLPETRTISDQGFKASWRVSSFGRTYPSRWTSADAGVDSSESGAFGVDLFVPIGIYQLTTRATKYAILFIGLTFVACFMFEVVAGLRLHPLQYLLVGLANTLFYLLLLSLAEHSGFGAAYLISTLASAGLITGYSLSVLGTRKKAMLMLLVLGVLYGVLYMMLRAESYAMLAGSTGLWVTLGLIMYLTRNIDWFAQGTDAATGSST